MEGQDSVLVLSGNWIIDPDGKWMFDPLPNAGSNYLRLQTGMSYGELVQDVKETLKFQDENITVKLSYQYPEWLDVDDEPDSRPQYISEDQDVTAFVEIRRAIEEVNLFVTASRVIGEVTTAVLQREQTRDLQIGDNVEGPNDGSESENEWHEFAMSDTPLTLATQPELHPKPKKKRGLETFLRTGNGITIREAGHALPSPSNSHKDKGKGKAIAEEEASDSDSDMETQRHHIHSDCRSLKAVRRRLFHTPNTNTYTVSDKEEDNSNGEQGNDRDDDSQTLTVWGRFEDSLHSLLTDASTNPVLFERDAPPVLEGEDNDAVDAALADIQYEGDKIFLGRVFKSKIDCKIKVAIHAINRRFHFRTARSTPQFMVMKCYDRACSWRVYAVKLDKSGNFQIRQAFLQHRCSTDKRRNYHRLATTQVIGEIIQSKFVGVKRGPSPAGVRKIMLDEFHVNISYWKAWRAREVAMDMVYGNMAGSYAILPAYLALLKTANPGSLCFLEIVENPDAGTRFKYSFTALGASIKGYPFMRKVIVVDGTSLKGRYGGCLISACAQDANFQIFPLAFGVVDSENDDAWEWFFRKLSHFVVDSSDLVFVSDRHSSIYTALERVYPMAHHAACVVHLWRNVRGGFRPKRIASMMGAAARSYTVAEFNKKFVEIQSLNPGCAAYLVDIGFQHWSRAHFKGNRFNIMDTNIVESWNAVLKEAREFPLICMLEYIRTAVMTWFAVRRAKTSRAKGLVTPHARKRMEKNFLASTSLAVRAISGFEFQVQAPNGECFCVNLMEGTCTCLQYQTLGIPCPHAMSAAGSIEMATDGLVTVAHSVETWKRSYEGRIYPVPSVGNDEIGGGFRGDLMPPAVRRPPGRPVKKRIPSRGEVQGGTRKSSRRCTRCRLQGHNKASCRNPI